MDLILLVLVNKVMKFAATNWKLLLSATFGACWSIVVVMIPGAYKLFLNICTYILIGPIMIRICAGNNMKCVLKGTMVLMGMAILMGGLLHFLYYNTYAGYLIKTVLIGDEQLVLFVLFSTVTVIMILRWILLGKSYSQIIRKVQCVVDGERVDFTAIIDTGNRLLDPVTGKPVSIIEKRTMGNILNKINDYTKVKYHLIPFQTVGCENGMMEVITVDIMYIYSEKSTEKYENVLIGLTENKLSSQNVFHALINPQLLE